MGTFRSSRFPVCCKEISIDFETLYNERVEKCSHETAFNKEEARALYNLCWGLPGCSNVVEIGVEYGRSTAVIGTVLQDKGDWSEFIAVDPDPKIEKLHINTWKLPIRLIKVTSQDAAKQYGGNMISLIHIDGDHTYEAVSLDCHLWLPRVRLGGYACFDDYGHPGLEGVKAAVDEYMEHRTDLWKYQGTFGNKLAVFRKLSYG